MNWTSITNYIEWNVKRQIWFTSDEINGRFFVRFIQFASGGTLDAGIASVIDSIVEEAAQRVFALHTAELEVHQFVLYSKNGQV